MYYVLSQHGDVKDCAVRVDILPLIMHDGGAAAKWLTEFWPLFCSDVKIFYMDIDARDIGKPDLGKRYLKVGVATFPDDAALYLHQVSNVGNSRGFVSTLARSARISDAKKNFTVPIYSNHQVTCTGSVKAATWLDAGDRMQTATKPRAILSAALNPNGEATTWMIRQRARGTKKFDLSDAPDEDLDCRIRRDQRSSVNYAHILKLYKKVRSNVTPPMWPLVRYKSVTGRVNCCVLAGIHCLVNAVPGSDGSVVCTLNPKGGGKSMVTTLLLPHGSLNSGHCCARM